MAPQIARNSPTVRPRSLLASATPHSKEAFGNLSHGLWSGFEFRLIVFEAMLKLRTIAMSVIVGCLTIAGGIVTASEIHSQSVALENSSSAHSESEGLPQRAVELGRPWGFSVTNSMVVTWIVAACLILLAQIATRHMKQRPDGLQNFWEWMVESLHDFLEGVIGPALVKKTFWFFASVFIFILFANWAGLIPGVGTIGWGHQTSNGFHVDKPLFRGVNADLNMTLAMALVFFVCWGVWSVEELGPGGFLKELFAPKGETTGFLKALMIIVFFAVGCLDIISILFRPVSLSFRLYGNIFAGENMLEAMGKILPGFGWLLPVPFYFMELLVGFVQALVFMLLTAVFTMLMCPPAEGRESTH